MPLLRLGRTEEWEGPKPMTVTYRPAGLGFFVGLFFRLSMTLLTNSVMTRGAPRRNRKQPGWANPRSELLGQTLLVPSLGEFSKSLLFWIPILFLFPAVLLAPNVIANDIRVCRVGFAKVSSASSVSGDGQASCSGCCGGGWAMTGAQSRDLSRCNLRSLRGLISSSTSGAVTLSQGTCAPEYAVEEIRQ